MALTTQGLCVLPGGCGQTKQNPGVFPRGVWLPPYRILVFSQRLCHPKRAFECHLEAVLSLPMQVDHSHIAKIHGDRCASLAPTELVSRACRAFRVLCVL